jgi:DNA mismatch repair protein MutS2
LWSRTAGEAHSALAPGEPDAAGGLVLRAFRHPLLVEHERAGRIARAVPLDLRLGGDFDTLVITGPNTGGKTLALKSAGLAVLFARLGFPLACARGTTVPLYECVAADIGDGQEVQQNLSTFAAHLRRIAGGVARAGPRTLVLLDELGGGTDPDEGAALGEALLAWFAARGAHTLATTHLSRLKEFAFRHARAENAHAVFDLESLAPTYEIVVGAAGQSRALAVAARLGLPDEILAPARERLERRDAEVALLLGELERERLRTERRRREAEDELERTRGARAEAERAREEAQARQGTLANEAQRAIDEKLAGARAALAALERRLEQVPGAARAALAEAVGALARELAGASLSERRAAWLAGLRKGDLVWVPRLAKRLPLHRLDRARGEAVLRVGRAEMRVAVADISDVAVV